MVVIYLEFFLKLSLKSKASSFFAYLLNAFRIDPASTAATTIRKQMSCIVINQTVMAFCQRTDLTFLNKLS